MLTKSYRVRAEVLSGLSSLFKKYDIAERPLLDNVGIAPEDLSSIETRISFANVVNLLEKASNVCGDEIFAFHLAIHQQALSLGVLGQLAWACPNVETAIRQTLKYLHVQSRGSYWRLDICREQAILSCIPPTEFNSKGAQLALYNMTQAFLLLKSLCGKEWSPLEVWLDSPPLSQSDILEQALQANVRFEQPYAAIVFDKSDLALSIETVHQQLRLLLEKHIRQQLAGSRVDASDNSFTIKTRLLIEHTLSSGHCTAEHIARMLSIPAYTLRRRLKAEGCTFKQLLQQIQFEKAQYYLRDDALSLTDISFLLGYSELSAFSRAYKKQTGHSPLEWRESI